MKGSPAGNEQFKTLVATFGIRATLVLSEGAII